MILDLEVDPMTQKIASCDRTSENIAICKVHINSVVTRSSYR